MAVASTPSASTGGGADLSALLGAVARRNRDAFERLYEATVDRVLGLITRIVGDSDAADDVASDVYLQVWRQAGRYDPGRGSAMAWLLTISRSRALDSLRRRASRIEKMNEMCGQAMTPAGEADPPDLLMAVDRSSAVHRALQSLEPGQRQLLSLAFFRGFTHTELARLTGRPLGTVKTQIRRTLSELRERLGEEQAAAGDGA